MITSIKRSDIDNTVTITTLCPFCRALNKVTVDYDQYMVWQRGAMIQRAMPKVPARERELLITGICDDCFPKEDE